MARKVKIDNAVQKRFARQETSRKTNVKPLRRFFLIVCEGTRTEPNYFEGLKRSFPPGVVNLVVEGTGHNTLTVIDDALKAKTQYERSGRTIDEIWAVFDRDSFPEEHFNNAIFKGRATGVQCAWTNQAFELWYLLHFQFFQNGMNRDDYARLLERELSSRTGEPYKYEKNSHDMFALLQRYGNVEQAISRAKQLEEAFVGQTNYANHNPCTKVYELIERLMFPVTTPETGA